MKISSALDTDDNVRPVMCLTFKDKSVITR